MITVIKVIVDPDLDIFRQFVFHKLVCINKE